jgi:hypothetical protein
LLLDSPDENAKSGGQNAWLLSVGGHTWVEMHFVSSFPGSNIYSTLTRS